MEHYKLDEEIKRIIGKNARLFLDLAAYVIGGGKSNAVQYYPDYAYNHPFFTEEMKVYSDSKISSFLRDIKRDDSIVFQSDWNEKKDVHLKTSGSILKPDWKDRKRKY